MSPIFTKLNLKDETEIFVFNVPKSFEPLLAMLADKQVRRKITTSSKVHFALAFAITQADVDTATEQLTARAAGDAILWFAYPKQSSKKYKCEFNRDTGWAALGVAGYEPVRQVAIDEDWSALRFRKVEFIKSLTRASSRTVSAGGQSVRVGSSIRCA
jgi:hypothetical protein